MSLRRGPSTGAHEVQTVDSLSPEYQRALRIISRHVEVGHREVTPHMPPRVHLEGFSFLLPGKAPVRALPSPPEWHWNQAKSKAKVVLPDPALEVELCKLVPRVPRSRAGLQARHTVTAPSFKLWLYYITCLADGQVFTLLWCERGLAVSSSHDQPTVVSGSAAPTLGRSPPLTNSKTMVNSSPVSHSYALRSGSPDRISSPPPAPTHSLPPLRQAPSPTGFYSPSTGHVLSSSLFSPSTGGVNGSGSLPSIASLTASYPSLGSSHSLPPSERVLAAPAPEVMRSPPSSASSSSHVAATHPPSLHRRFPMASPDSPPLSPLSSSPRLYSSSGRLPPSHEIAHAPPRLPSPATLFPDLEFQDFSAPSTSHPFQRRRE